jgi:hypothetical protein
MRKFTASLALVIALATATATAQTAPQTHYSAAKTPLGTLLADPAARAAVGQRFPMLLQSKAVTSGKANRLTLRTLKYFKPKIFNDAALAAIDADFARMPAR